MNIKYKILSFGLATSMTFGMSGCGLSSDKSEDVSDSAFKTDADTCVVLRAKDISHGRGLACRVLALMSNTGNLKFVRCVDPSLYISVIQSGDTVIYKYDDKNGCQCFIENEHGKSVASGAFAFRNLTMENAVAQTVGKMARPVESVYKNAVQIDAVPERKKLSRADSARIQAALKPVRPNTVVDQKQR